MAADSLALRNSLSIGAVAPLRYLSALVVVARAAKRGEYVVIHFGSASFFRTDRLGAILVRSLVDGRSDLEAMHLVDQIEAGAGERAQGLIFVLEAKGAMTRMLPAQTGRGRRWRSLASKAMGLVVSAIGPIVRLAPISFLAWMLALWPSSPIGRHVWRANRWTVVNNLRASGYAHRDEGQLLDMSRHIAGHSRNYFFMYLSVGLLPRRRALLVNRLFERDSVDGLVARLESSGPTIGVYLHGPLCVALPMVLHTRGQVVVRSLIPRTHGTKVCERSGPLEDFFGEPREVGVDVTRPDASGAMLRHLKAGRSLYLGLDESPLEGRVGPEIGMLGQRWTRNDWPAWIAVRSGRPLALWTTHDSPAGIVVTSSPLLYPDPSLPLERRVAELSTRLYGHAEVAIRNHPEDWTGWGYLSFLTRSAGRDTPAQPIRESQISSPLSP
jgi:lauroyl/myristoyl acyltransferase